MDKKLKRLISDYQTSVRSAVELMHRSGIPLPITAGGWVRTDIPYEGELDGGVSYRKHGTGCQVDLPTGSVDFDFGSIGEINGFDLWRLTEFVDGEIAKYGFESEDAIKRSFEAAVRSGELALRENNLFYLTHAERLLATEINRDTPNDLLPHYDQDEVVALNVHSFLAADLMRKNYRKLASKLDKNKYLSQKDEVEFRIYFSTWLGFLYATCERFIKPDMSELLKERRPESFGELVPQSGEITRKIKLHSNALRKFRNNVFHTREDVKPIMLFAADDAGRLSWAGELHAALAGFFSMYRILCEEHYLTRGRFEESQIRKQSAKRKARRFNSPT
ncbi:DUF6896 domain-containing protein [Duganella sp. Dugasp56]|uniref:DUF6896 domain-containing protein n=1 Tax=Duganella sp. Dugasp56 TaxID=3243046 RepID=UPI0039AF2376